MHGLRFTTAVLYIVGRGLQELDGVSETVFFFLGGGVMERGITK